MVTVGLAATVHLTAFSSRGLPRVEGFVRSLSADRVVDEATGQAYYLARVEVPREELAALDQHLQGSAGALANLRQAARRLDRLGPEHPLLAEALSSLDRAVIEAAEAEDKIEHAREAVAEARKALGRD